MAKKRASLDDKKIFDTNKIDGLLESTSPSEGTTETVSEGDTLETETTTSETSTTTSITTELTETSDIATETPLPSDEPSFEETAFGDTSFELEALSAESEASIGSSSFAGLSEDLPYGEAGEIMDTIDDTLDFPTASEIPPGGPLTEDLPQGEAGDLNVDVDDVADFPPASSTPPSGVTVPDLPSDEVGNTGSGPEFVATSPLSGSTSTTNPIFDPSTAVDTNVTSKPVPPPVSPPPTPEITSNTTNTTFNTPPAPSTATGSPSISPSRPIYITGEDIGGIDLGYLDLAESNPFELPKNLEVYTEEESKRGIRLLDVDPRLREQYIQTYNAVDALYKEVTEDGVVSSMEITDWCFKLLAEARQILTRYQIEYLSKAEWNVEQVRARIKRGKVSVNRSQYWSLRITIWGMLWFLIFIFFIFRPESLDFMVQTLVNGFLISIFGTEPQIVENELFNASIFLRTIFFGGIGGIAAVFYSLLRYVSKRTFDSEYVLSYFFKPFMGLIAGSLVYLIVFIVMRTLGFYPAGTGPTNANPTISSEAVTFQVIAYFLAMAAGFKENLIFDLINKVMKAIFRDEPSEELPDAPDAPDSPSKVPNV